MLLDTTLPVPAVSLDWAEGTHHNALNVTASWTPSPDTDLASQSIEYFDDVLCTNSLGAAALLASVTSNTDIYTGVNGTTYYYQIINVDLASNSTTSNCSNPMTIDTVAPAAVAITGWTEAPLTANSVINANWTLSASTDIGTQSISMFTDAACTILAEGPISKANSAINHAFTPTGDGDYYYSVVVTDLAGNQTVSSCASIVTIDTTPPPAATTLAWVETSPNAGTSVNTTWVPSTDSNLASQTITYFTEPTCTTVDSGPLALLNTDNTTLFAGVDGTTYYYSVNSIDHVGNNTISACSTGILIDTTPPSAATATIWVETSPHDALTANASWTPSISGDVADQTITYYTDSACTLAEGTTRTLAAGATSDNFTGVDGNTYHYRLITSDNAGNTSLSPCSAIMSLDITAPSAQTALAWTGTSPISNTTIQATWVLSACISNPYRYSLNRLYY
jgi:hypothetical protein